MRPQMSMVLAVVLAAALFQLRPGDKELHEQWGSLRSGSNKFRGVGELVEQVGKVVSRRKEGLTPWDLESKRVVDYKLLTVAYPKSRKKGERLVGMAGVFFPYYDRDDLLLLGLCFVLSYLAGYKWPGWTYQFCKPSWQRPWSFVTTPFYTGDSILSTIMYCTSLVNSGEKLQDDVGRLPFLGIFFGTSFLAAVSELICRRSPRPVEGTPVAFAIIIHASLLYPNTRYNLYGMDLNGFSLVAVQMAIPMATSWMFFLDKFPLYSSGIIAGVISYIYFHERAAERLFYKYGIFLGDGKEPSSLILPLLGANLAISQYISHHYGG